MPSATQKRRIANGRSADAPTTVVFSSPAASSLNRRTEAAQVPVSRLGKMLRTTRDPANAADEKSARAAPARGYGGAVGPTPGRPPAVWAGVPRSVVVAMVPV